jgi:ubiquinone/menaquinone biosynthesis C-methylase UbiE
MTATSIPLTGEKWAAHAEAYAQLIAQRLTPGTRWLDAGTGTRLLEQDLDPLENWLARQSAFTVGMDVHVKHHRNIRTLVSGSIDELPFADRSFDLVTCNMVVEHLGEPGRAFDEVARVLCPGGSVVINTPNLVNYGVLANAVLSRVMPERLRLRIVRASDSREPEDIFPVRYRANTLRRLSRLLAAAGLKLDHATILPQQRPYLGATAPLEKILMAITPGVRLLVRARKEA